MMRFLRFPPWRRKSFDPATLVTVDADAVSLPSRQRPRAVFLSRGLCRFRFIPLVGVAGTRRKAALRLACEAWRPFPTSDYVAHVAGDGAEVFAWDAQALAGRLAGAGVSVRLPVWPETVLAAPVAGDAARLVAARHGVEGECWKRGRLTASRWWKQAPDALAWVNFQRVAGVAHDAIESEVPRLLPRTPASPWSDLLRGDDLASSLPWPEHIAYAALVLAFGASLLWQAGAVWRAHRALDDERAAFAEAERVTAPVLSARDAAMTSLARARALAAVLGAASPTAVLGALSRDIPDDGTQVREFEYRDGAIRIVLAPSPALSRTTLVRVLEETPGLLAVTVSSQPGSVLLVEAKVDAERLASASASVGAGASLATTAPIAAAPGGPAPPTTSTPLGPFPTPAAAPVANVPGPVPLPTGTPGSGPSMPVPTVPMAGGPGSAPPRPPIPPQGAFVAPNVPTPGNMSVTPPATTPGVPAGVTIPAPNAAIPGNAPAPPVPPVPRP